MLTCPQYQGYRLEPSGVRDSISDVRVTLVCQCGVKMEAVYAFVHLVEGVEGVEGVEQSVGERLCKT